MVPGPRPDTSAKTAPVAGLIRYASAPAVPELRTWKVCIPGVTWCQPVPHAPLETVMTFPAAVWLPQPDSPAASSVTAGARQASTRRTPRTGRASPVSIR